MALIARYWTWLFGIFLGLSYFIVYPFEVVFPAIERGINYYDPGQYGVAQTVFKAPTFWFCLIVVYICCFGHRYLERAVVWLFTPQVGCSGDASDGACMWSCHWLQPAEQCLLEAPLPGVDIDVAAREVRG